MRSSGFLTALIGIYIAFWLSNISQISWLRESSYTFTIVGIGLGMLALIVSLMFFFRFRPTKNKVILAILLNIVGIAAFVSLPIAGIFFGVMTVQGFLLGLGLLSSFTSSAKFFGMSVFSISIFSALILPIILTGLNDTYFGVINILIGAILLILLAIVSFSKTIETLHVNHTSLENDTNKSSWIESAIFILLLTVEVSFFVAALLLQDVSQSIFHRLTLPFTLILMLLFRLFVGNIPDTFTDKGWLFVGTLLVTISCGFLFTMDITAIFIVIFAMAIVFSQKIAKTLFKIQIGHQFISLVFMILAVSMVIFGLYIDNHIAYILSIKMPEKMLHLSALQAWAKELSGIAGLALILSGVRYLRS